MKQDTRPAPVVETNESGWVTFVLDGAGVQRRLTYDADGLVVAYFDGKDNLTRQSDGTWQSEGEIVLSSVQAFADGTVIETFGESGLMRSKLISGVSVTIDLVGRVTEIRLPDGRCRSFEYHPTTGRMVIMEALDGSIWTTEDGQTWLKRDSDAYWTGSIEIDLDGTYRQKDAQSGRIRVTRLDGTLTVLSPEGKVLREERPDGSIMEVVFDRSGRRAGKTISLPEGGSVSYNRNDQIVRVEMSGGEIRWFDRDDDGEVTEIRESTGAKWLLRGQHLYARNQEEKPINARLEVDATGAYSFHLSQPASRDFVCLRRNIDGSVSRLFASGMQSFRAFSDGSSVQLDEEEKVLVAVDANRRESRFRYDEQGRLSEVVDEHGRVWRRRDLGDWASEDNGGKTAASLEVDPSGNVKFSWTDGTATVHRAEGPDLEFDSSGNLRAIRRTGSTTQCFEYDEKGELIRCQDPDGTCWLLVDGGWRTEAGASSRSRWCLDGHVLVERAPDGVRRRHLLDGSIEILAPGGSYLREVRRADGTLAVKNRRGQTVKLTGPDGRVNEIRYTEEGKPLLKRR